MDDPQESPPVDFVGYCRCRDCGALVLASFGNQTGHRCASCWKDCHPLATLEVMNDSYRFTARSVSGNRINQAGRAPTGWSLPARQARAHAFRRLATTFPDLYAMILDEERVARGLAPMARYEPVDFDETASKTLGFEDVYDALDRSGASDA